MRQFLTAQSMDKRKNQQQEKENNKVFTQIWKDELERDMQKERDQNEKVLFIF